MVCYCLWLILVLSVELVKSQEDPLSSSCYGSGSIAASVLLTLLFTFLILVALYYLWKKYRKRKDLILESDPEKGKAEYAFDNPGFKDAGLTPIGKALEKNKLDSGSKPKWNQWAPLTALTTKSEKKRTQDDSAIDGNEVKVVALRSHDFTGLGFNICGNMKDGIYIKDVLHRGPASESGKLNSGDRINSVTISFEHMVYEDALTILSYASPYEVIIEARGGKIIHHGSGQGAQPTHPVYRSSSCADLYNVNSSAKKKLFAGDDYTSSLSSNYSSLQKSRSNMTTLERKNSESPKVKQSNNNARHKKPPKAPLNPELLKSQLEQKILADHQNNLMTKNNNHNNVNSVGAAASSRIEQAEVQKSENKHHKFGIRVLPPETSPKSAEQNDNNINIEKTPTVGIDEVDETVVTSTKPQVKKREKKPEQIQEEKVVDVFDRNNAANGSGIKRDVNGIPQEIPAYMLNAAVAARTNRKTSEDRTAISKGNNEDVDKTPKKSKGKAPAPPDDNNKSKTNFDEIHSVVEEVTMPTNKNKVDDASNDETNDLDDSFELPVKNHVKDYNSDSDMEADNQSSMNTIELNSSDITIHHAEETDERQNGRKTASTGDLTKIQKTRKFSSGTLERAQSLDITDTSIPSLKRKGGRIEDDMESDEDLSKKFLMSKEPRLSLILDGLNTFQRNRLKKSTEWGNLEDALQKLNQEDNPSLESSQHLSLEDSNFVFGGKTEEFDALVNKINEIKRESIDMSANSTKKEEVVPEPRKPEEQTPEKKVKNQIWPFDPKPSPPQTENDSLRFSAVEKRQRKPVELENGGSVLLPPPSTEKPPVVLKPIISEKKENLLASPKKVQPPVIPLPEEVPIVANTSDETKILAEPPPKPTEEQPSYNYLNLVDMTRNFIFTEKIANSQDEDDCFLVKNSDTNVSDDIKVSRHSLGSLERPKSDDAKMSNVSNVTVNKFQAEEKEELHSLELNVNETGNTDMSELYTTALDSTLKPRDVEETPSRVTISTPDIIKNVTIAEAINTVNNDVIIQGPSSLTLEVTRPEVGPFSPIKSDADDSAEKTSSLTYITEIQVLTPNTTTSSTNISEIEIVPNNSRNGSQIDSDFESYVKNFESNVRTFESKIPKLELEDNSSSKSIVITDSLVDAEKEVNKIHEIVEEQLKKLPEMRFTTSSYNEVPRTPEKRQSQIELLRSNFEKSPPKSKNETTPTKSRIPISTTMKTPPMSPERRDSKNLDMENDKAILELMSSTVHSTPIVSKYQAKPNKNVTVTSIRSNSKIPSGLPVLASGSSRPPIPPRKHDDDNMVQVSTTNGVESSFKQWVFNPAEHAVTNIVVSEGNNNNNKHK